MPTTSTTSRSWISPGGLVNILTEISPERSATINWGRFRNRNRTFSTTPVIRTGFPIMFSLTILIRTVFASAS